MAPALTQTAEPPILADSNCHSPSDATTNTFSPYGDLKKLNKRKISVLTKEFFETGGIYLTNGDTVPSGLAPPASGWAEGSPVPNTLPYQSNMDEHFPAPHSDSGSNCNSSVPISGFQSASSNTNMGLESCIKKLNIASDLENGPEAVIPTQEGTAAVMNNPNDLLALVGRDFDNVNDIIDTLQRLASNPELLDAAARDLEPVGPNAPQTQAPEDRANSVLHRLNERQRHLERRRIFLLRRLRRFSSRGLAATVSSQLRDVTKHVRGVLDEEREKLQAKEKQDEPIGLEMLHQESMKSMSTSDLISLVRRVEASSNMQKMSDASSPKPQEKTVPSLPSPLQAELDMVSSEMRAAALSHLSYDSDATESSSGGESCDEGDSGFSKFNTDFKPIRERAFYMYCRTRGWVASKWTWLQAQVADLDYKILQQQKLLAHIRKTKGAVRLSEESPSAVPRRSFTRSPAHLEMQDPALTCIATPRTVLNGFHPANRMEAAESPFNPHANCNPDTSSGSARTVGVEKVKRRRYVRPNVSFLRRCLGGTPISSSSSVSVNNYRVSSILCKCVPPLNCILCMKSRTTNKNIVSYGNHLISGTKFRPIASFHQSLADKVAKGDQSFHPILSRREEMLQVEIFNSVLKTSGWQQMCPQSHSSSLPVHPVSEQSTRASSGPPTSSVTGGVALDSLSSSCDSQPPLAKRNKRDREHKRNGRRKHSRDESKERITLTQNHSNKKSVDSVDETDDEVTASWQVSTAGSGCSSPCPSPALGGDRGAKGSHADAKSSRKSSSATRQKQNSTSSSSYDINNIVIPFRMAAASRVEMIQYKEIPTPKWRVEDLQPLRLSAEELEELEEDISENYMIARHSRSEEMERKKFLACLKAQVHSRSSRTRRADSSGTNTPDHPLSPRLLEPMETPVSSPLDPSCLLEASEDSNHSTSLKPTSTTQSSSSSTVLTLSLSSLQSSMANSAGGPVVAESKSAMPLPSESDTNDSSTATTSNKVKPNATLTILDLSSLSSPAASGPPAVRTRRFLSGSVAQFEKVKINEDLNDNDRLSPFPCREFPLNENEYLDLVHENREHVRPSTRLGPDPAGDISGHRTSTPTPVSRRRNSQTDVAAIRNDFESGQNTPLSELTDSAPEEETSGVWDEKSPDWTISAMNDDCGGFVLSIQKN